MANIGGYVIKREDGCYVTPPGSVRSYTRSIAHARIYDTSYLATADACENERVVPLAGELGRKS